MKVCFKCSIEKPLTEYYKHKQMGDGHLNKCKTCTKKDTKIRSDILISTPEGLEKERQRHRDKYHRLNYKDKQKIWDRNKPWKKTYEYKNLNRDLNIKKGFEAHHWNYNNGFLKDVIIMPIKDHRKLHTLIELDEKELVFKTKKDGKYIASKLDHVFFIMQMGLKFEIK